MIYKVTPEKLVNTNQQKTWKEAIPFLGGRPDREVVIGTDDVTNLIIACNTCASLEEFFRQT